MDIISKSLLQANERLVLVLTLNFTGKVGEVKGRSISSGFRWRIKVTNNWVTPVSERRGTSKNFVSAGVEER